MIRLTVHGTVATAYGPALRIQIEREDGAAMGFREVYEAFASAYPGRWAVQTLPPREWLLDGANRYHLHVLNRRPEGLDLCRGEAPR